MSDEGVEVALFRMRDEDDPLLPQYIVSIHGPQGWTLRQIAAAANLSPEWVRQLELKGMREIAEGDRKDLSALPRASRKRKRTITNVAEYLPPETVAVLKTMNEEAVAYRGKAHNKAKVESFNKMIQLLLDAGVPIRAIATALDEDYLTFYRRMRRWGVHPPGYVKPEPKVRVDYCTDPACPIPGKHVHG